MPARYACRLQRSAAVVLSRGHRVFVCDEYVELSLYTKCSKFRRTVPSAPAQTRQQFTDSWIRATGSNLDSRERREASQTEGIWR